jgi:streptogramin lyase
MRGFVAVEQAYWIALLVRAYNQGGTTTAGIVAVVQLAPAALFAPFGAVLADRHSPVRVQTLAFAVQASALGATAISLLLGWPDPVSYTLAALASVALALTRPTQAVLLPSLARVPQELTAANVVSSWVASSAAFLAPALTGVLLAIGSPGVVFAVCAAVMASAALLLARTTRPVRTATVPKAGRWALMDRIDCDLALGRHEQALGELNLLVREHPLRERLRAQQMLALYRADRQAEALEAYAEARQTLVNDLGIEPSEALQRLQQAILRHDPSLETPEGTAAVNGLAPARAPPPQAPAVEAGAPAARRRFRPRRWQLAIAVLVILAASAVAALTLRSGKIVSVTPVGAEPQGIAITPRGIWTNHLTENLVTRYDLRTHKAQTLGTPPEPFAVVADAGNAWVSSLRSSSTITRFAAFGRGPSAGWGPLDPAATSKIHLPPPGAVSLALGSGYLWAVAGPKTTPGTDDRVWLVDPASNRVVRSLRLGRQTTSIAFGEGAAWIGAFASEHEEIASFPAAWTGASWLFSIRTGAVGLRTQSYRLDETGDTAGPSAVAVGDNRVWVLTCGNCNQGQDTQKLLEFDPGKRKVVWRKPLGSRNPNALAVGAGSVWLVSQVDASVLQLDPKTRRIRTIPVGNPRTASTCGIAATRDAVWAAVGDRYCEDTGG